MSCSKWQNNQCTILNNLCNCKVNTPQYIVDIHIPLCQQCKKEWIDTEPTIENPSQAILHTLDRIIKNNTNLNISQYNNLQQISSHSTVQQISSYVNSLVDYTKSGFKNVSEETYQKRLEICNNCENYDKDNNKCNICGCQMAGSVGFMSKLRMAHESCPLNPPKWGPEIKN